jgi:hypothetical protein
MTRAQWVIAHQAAPALAAAMKGSHMGDIAPMPVLAHFC